MTRVVAKFGGTSVGSPERIRHAAQLIKASADKGEQPIVVVSAMAGETDRILGLAGEFGAGLGDGETDVALAAGEQVSAALMALALRAEGLEAQSVMGWQAPVVTTGPSGAASIADLGTEAFEALLAQGVVPVLAGYQGIDPTARIQTLGRGGTDLSAAALAAALGARCDIYTDVDGVYTTDPRIEPQARRLDAVSHDEMLELAAQGAKVLQPRSVEFAKARAVPMRVLSSFAKPGEAAGTDVVAGDPIAEKRLVSGIAYAREQARIALLGQADAARVAPAVFEALAKAVNLTFTTGRRDAVRAADIMKAAQADLAFEEIRVDEDVAKVSVVGAGLRQRADVARSLFGVLADSGIEVKVLATSEIKISALIENEAVERAVRALHSAYGLDQV